ncbi:MAG: FtsB family cell division protein [Chitinophagaceae bacterium]
MKFTYRTLSIFKNKYIVAFVAFIVLMVFFDQNNIFVQLDRKKQLDNLLSNKNYYKSEIEKTKKQLNDLQKNPAAVEKYARENFYMKKSNEDVFIVQNPADSAKK